MVFTVMNPIYTTHNLTPAYSLRYSWGGFPKQGSDFTRWPMDDVLKGLAPEWEKDGINLLEHKLRPQGVQLTLSTSPQVSPTVLAARAKGRLQHGLREHGVDAQFARNFAVRSLGENDRRTAEDYVRGQLKHADLADPLYIEQLRQCALSNRDVDLESPTSSASGRYWYNLHVVLVIADRARINAKTTGMTIRDTCQAVAKQYGYGISTLSLMPDHLHMTIRGAASESPEEIVLHFKNNTAWALGQIRIWDDGYYAGTVGEYTMDAVR
jgi:REP element-mobilizing transposase RayT